MSLTSYRAAPSRAKSATPSSRKCLGCIEERLRLEFLTRFGSDLLSHVLRRSTISATALNGWVRNGARCFARAMTTKPRKKLNISALRRVHHQYSAVCMTLVEQMKVETLLLLDQIKPIEQLVPVN